MPIYEYECTSCCNVFEVVQRITEDPLSACPECSGPVKKLMSMSSFQLKGGGWYSDGYSSSAGNGSASGASCKASGDGSEKAEKKPDSSTESSVSTKKKESSAATA